MNVLDWILISLILLFGVWGFRKGFLQAIGALIGVVVATVIAGIFFLQLGNFFGGTEFANIIAFFLIFGLVIKLVSLSFWLLGKLFRLVSILPFIETFNKALGLFLGLAAGILVLVVLVYFLNKYPLNSWFVENLKTSVVAGVLLKVSVIFKPILPEALKKLKGVI